MPGSVEAVSVCWPSELGFRIKRVIEIVIDSVTSSQSSAVLPGELR